MADLKSMLQGVRDLAGKVAADPGKYKADLDVALEAIGDVHKLVSSLSSGDAPAVTAKLQEWDDVAATQQAIKDVDAEIEAEKGAINVGEVAAAAHTAFKVALMIAGAV